jgi:DNA-binding LacI/PurR family transcriptional regulator
MSAMLERVRRPNTPPRDIQLECTLVERKSCTVRAAGLPMKSN